MERAHTPQISPGTGSKNTLEQESSVSRRILSDPYSPDLNPPDFYLWGYLKDRVYSTKPRTISELKKNIREEIRKIPTTVCKNVMNNLVVRLKKCTELKGGHLEHLL